VKAALQATRSFPSPPQFFCMLRFHFCRRIAVFVGSEDSWPHPLWQVISPFLFFRMTLRLNPASVFTSQGLPFCARRFSAYLPSLNHSSLDFPKQRLRQIYGSSMHHVLGIFFFPFGFSPSSEQAPSLARLEDFPKRF